ncbi:MAG: hypothetical protein CMB80_00760, partial [Flammeovirgaceae bacterium]|nr:hypothetical protein [Flammeovirgaceae bacterium]
GADGREVVEEFSGTYIDPTTGDMEAYFNFDPDEYIGHVHPDIEFDEELRKIEFPRAANEIKEALKSGKINEKQAEERLLRLQKRLDTVEDDLSELGVDWQPSWSSKTNYDIPIEGEPASYNDGNFKPKDKDFDYELYWSFDKSLNLPAHQFRKLGVTTKLNSDHKFGYPVSVSMTPAFWDDDQLLLKSQLKCLSDQTVDYFDVWMFDSHYEKRKDIVPELADRYSLDIKHVPYIPAIHISKKHDCSIFNAAFVYSPSPMNVRLSCWRFVTPTFIETIMSAPRGVNVDFYFLNVGPDYGETTKGLVESNHKRVFDFDREEIDWSFIPERSASLPDGSKILELPNSLGNWPEEFDTDSEIMDAHHGMCGNIAWNREQWIYDLNGTNEVITNASHWEDMDFGNRARLAGHRIIRRTRQMYRLHHMYGSYQHRSNVETDYPYIFNCSRCDWTYNEDFDKMALKLIERRDLGEIEFFEDCVAWVCKHCLLSGPIIKDTGEHPIVQYFNDVEEYNGARSPVIKKYKIGRNLPVLVEKIDKEITLQGKFDVFNDSWENEYYYGGLQL